MPDEPDRRRAEKAREGRRQPTKKAIQTLYDTMHERLLQPKNQDHLAPP